MLTLNDLNIMLSERCVNIDPILCIANEKINLLMEQCYFKPCEHYYYITLLPIITKTNITNPIKYCKKFIKPWFKICKDSNDKQSWLPDYKDSGFIIPAVIYKGIFYIHSCVKTISDGRNFLFIDNSPRIVKVNCEEKIMTKTEYQTSTKDGLT